jgi:hypothetical protein
VPTALTSAQLQTLKTDIAASPDLSFQPNTADGAFEIARLYNLTASPSFTVWRKNVSITEVGDRISGTELAGLSSLNNTRLQTVVVLSANGINPSLPDRRQFFDDIFSGAGGVQTRANLLALWKKLATRGQKLFSTGTGSDVSPATTAANIGDGFLVSITDVLIARELP